jgi:predicted nucleic acid-binding protein
LTQSRYEESLMNSQVNKLKKGEKANNTSNKYNLRSKKKEGDFDNQDQPLIAERLAKPTTITTKEKKTQNNSPTAKEHVSEVKEVLKPLSSFSF